MLDNLQKRRKFIFIILIVSAIILIALIFSILSSNKEKIGNESGTDETLIFNGGNSDSSSDDSEEVQDGTEYISSNEQERNQYASSGEKSEFITVDFTYVDIGRTSLNEYFSKLIGYYNQGNTKAMLANVNPEYAEKNKLNESNVKDFYKKSGINSDYKIDSVCFWGVNDSIFLVKLKNDLAGSSHTIGVDMKMYDNCQAFNIYPENFFEECGFKLQDNNVVKTGEEKKLISNFDNFTKNEYNVIDFGG